MQVQDDVRLAMGGMRQLREPSGTRPRTIDEGACRWVSSQQDRDGWPGAIPLATVASGGAVRVKVPTKAVRNWVTSRDSGG